VKAPCSQNGHAGHSAFYPYQNQHGQGKLILIKCFVDQAIEQHAGKEFIDIEIVTMTIVFDMAAAMMVIVTAMIMPVLMPYAARMAVEMTVFPYIMATMVAIATVPFVMTFIPAMIISAVVVAPVIPIPVVTVPVISITPVIPVAVARHCG
jgi:hypothetical protein